VKIHVTEFEYRYNNRENSLVFLKMLYLKCYLVINFKFMSEDNKEGTKNTIANKQSEGVMIQRRCSDTIVKGYKPESATDTKKKPK
jgi:hypothetical protein